MNYLFLDLSTHSTGWCVAKSKQDLQQYGCIEANDESYIKRIIKISKEIKKIIQQYDIKKIVAEEVRTDYKNIHTYKLLTYLQFSMLLAAYEIDPKIEVEFIQPSTWRSTIGIKTGAGIKREKLKKEDIKYVKTNYNIDANDDVCDSICIKDAYFIKNTEESAFHWGA